MAPAQLTPEQRLRDAGEAVGAPDRFRLRR